MDASILLQKLRAQREFTVEVEPGKKLRVRRPAEAQMWRYRQIGVEQACACVVGWEGITEADLLGASVGASDPAPFDEALCMELVSDRSEWAGALADALAKSIGDHLERKAAAVKN